MMTVNISLPKQLYKAAKKLVAEEKYSSLSELVRTGLRRTIDEADKITENGFPGWFEDKVLEAAEEPVSKSKDWKIEEDTSRVKRSKDDQSQTDWHIPQMAG